jgi:hypothetical protein
MVVNGPTLGIVHRTDTVAGEQLLELSWQVEQAVRYTNSQTIEVPFRVANRD